MEKLKNGVTIKLKYTLVHDEDKRRVENGQFTIGGQYGIENSVPNKWYRAFAACLNYLVDDGGWKTLVCFNSQSRSSSEKYISEHLFPAKVYPKYHLKDLSFSVTVNALNCTIEYERLEKLDNILKRTIKGDGYSVAVDIKDEKHIAIHIVYPSGDIHTTSLREANY